MNECAFSIQKFCEAHAISRSMLFQLWKAGQGPAVMKIGRRTLISREAAEAWRRQMEQSAQRA